MVHNPSGIISFCPSTVISAVPVVIEPSAIWAVIPLYIFSGDIVSSVKSTKTVTPGISATTYTPPNGYDYFSQFTVNAIPYSESDNAAGGKTVTIAGS